MPVFKPCGLKLEFVENGVFETSYIGTKPILPFAKSDVFEADIIRWRRLSADNEACKAIYEITLDVKDSCFNFRAGDTIGVIPQNVETEVNFLLDHLDLTSFADVPYILSLEDSKKKIPAHVPVKSTLRYVFTNCIDIRSILKKLFLLALSKYTKDEEERKILDYLISKEGSADYKAHILNRNLCLLHIFRLFPSCKPPIEIILAHMPRLLPRPYSIVNSFLKKSDEIKICFSVMDIGNTKKGLASGNMEGLILNLEHSMSKLTLTDCDKKSYGKVNIYLRENLSMFNVPNDLKQPLIMIGPGTGVAPFIGFLEEMEVRSMSEEVSGEVWLYFGCRDPKLDFIYEEELKSFVAKGILNELITSFSKINGERKYIQDALLQNGDEIVKLIKRGASIFICGDVKKMAAQVRDVLVQCLVKYDEKSPEEADNLLKAMQTEKKYFVDTWN